MNFKLFFSGLLVRYRQNQVDVLESRIEKGELFTPFPFSLLFNDDSKKDLVKHERLLGEALHNKFRSGNRK